MSVISLNFASVVATFTPKDPSIQPIVFKADVFWTEDQMLSEPQPDRERAKYFAGNDGESGQWIDIFAFPGKRDLMLIDSVEAEKLENWAYRNPQPLFDLAFFYKRNDQDASEARTQMHYNCKILNHPMRVPSNDIVSVRYNIGYAKIQKLNANGQPI